jgi:oligoendopeptidase F
MSNLQLNTQHKSWDLTKLKTKDDPEFAKLQKQIIRKRDHFLSSWQENDTYLSDPKILATALDEFERWCDLFALGGAQMYYQYMATSLDQSDPKLKAAETKAADFAKQIGNSMLFFSHRLSNIPEKQQQVFLSAKELKPYRHFLEQIFAEAKYLLSEKEEQLLNIVSKTAYEDWVKMTAEFVSKEERFVLDENSHRANKNFSEILGLINSPKQKVRDLAAKAFNSIIAKNLDVAVAEFNAVLEYKKNTDTLRKLPRPDAMRHLNDDIATEVVDTLVSTVAARNDLSHRYYRLKANLFKVKKLKYHERNVPYGEIEKEYPYPQAAQLVYQVFTQLDSQIGDIFKNFVEEGHIDVLPKKAKASGAFCASYLKSHPTYILLNHNNKLQDVLTLAHEAGHGVNNELIRKSQNALNFGTPVSTAEVASTFFEDFVLQEVLKTATQEEKLEIMLNKLNDDISTIHRQIAFYQFETEIHTKYRQTGFLSANDIGKVFRKHMAAYMGTAVEQSRGSQNWWIYVGHFRRFFYVYSYSSGLLISKALQHMVKENPKNITKVKQFLSAGTSDSPKNIFAQLGIDITDSGFWEKGLAEIEELLNQTEALARQLNKLPQ